jgi:hypothetical protein
VILQKLFTLTEYENMIPYERDIYFSVIESHQNEIENQRIENQSREAESHFKELGKMYGQT